MLTAENELLCQLYSPSISSEALQVVGSRACHALQDLNRVTRDAAPAAVVKWTAEASLVFVVRVDVYILVLL